MESWRRVWREGMAPVISTPALVALQKALVTDDSRLMQGCTTSPPPLMCVQDWPCEGGCAIGYCGWQGEGLPKVGDVEMYFARTCFECDQRMGETAACRWFLNWFDETPRPAVIRELLPEVEKALAPRMVGKTPPIPIAVDPELACLIQTIGTNAEKKAG